jgi:hypothetical protein
MDTMKKLTAEEKAAAAAMFPDCSADEQAKAFSTLSEPRQRLELERLKSKTPEGTPST